MRQPTAMLRDDLFETYLELTHKGSDLFLQSLIRNLSSPHIDFVPDKDDRNINTLTPEEG